MQADETSPPAISSRLRDSPASKDAAAFAIRVSTPPSERPKSQFPGLGKSPDGTLYATPDVRLHHRAVLVAAGDDGTGALGGLVRQLSIDQFENESRRVSIGTPGTDAGLKRTTTPTLDGTAAVAGIHKTVLAVLLRPREWRPQADRCDVFSSAFNVPPLIAHTQSILPGRDHDSRALRPRAGLSCAGQVRFPF